MTSYGVTVKRNIGLQWLLPITLTIFASIAAGFALARSSYSVLILIALAAVTTILLSNRFAAIWLLLGIIPVQTVIEFTVEQSWAFLAIPGAGGQMRLVELVLLFVTVGAVARLPVDAKQQRSNFPVPALGTQIAGVVFILLVLGATVNTYLAGTNGYSAGIRLLMYPVATFLVVRPLTDRHQIERVITWLWFLGAMFTVWNLVVGQPVSGHQGAILALGFVLTVELRQRLKAQHEVWKSRWCVVLLIGYLWVLLVMDQQQSNAIQALFAVWAYQVMRLWVMGRRRAAGWLLLPGLLAVALLLISFGITLRLHAAGVDLWHVLPPTWDEFQPGNLLDRAQRNRALFNLVRSNPFRLYFVEFYDIEFIGKGGRYFQLFPHNLLLYLATSLTVLAPVLLLFLVGRFIRFGIMTTRMCPLTWRGRVLALTALVPSIVVKDLLSLKSIHYEFSLLAWLAATVVAAIHSEYVTPRPTTDVARFSK